MNVIQLIRSLFLVVFVPMIALVGLLMCVGTIFNELRIERTLRASHGSAWQLQYEEIHGSLSDARTRVAVSCIGVVTITALTIWVIKLLGGSARGRTKKLSQEQYASSLERIMAYRRKALPRVYFGLAGIIVAVLLVVFRFGIFAERENELVLGIFIFVGGYCGLISGCSYWVKAKKWNEAVVVIGLLPVIILFIPYVRLVFLAVPNLLLMSMVMMPLILLVVVAVLPDKSGASKKRRNRRSHKQKRELSGVMD